MEKCLLPPSTVHTEELTLKHCIRLAQPQIWSAARLWLQAEHLIPSLSSQGRVCVCVCVGVGRGWQLNPKVTYFKVAQQFTAVNNSSLKIKNSAFPSSILIFIDAIVSKDRPSLLSIFAPLTRILHLNRSRWNGAGCSPALCNDLVPWWSRTGYWAVCREWMLFSREGIQCFREHPLRKFPSFQDKVNS